MARKYIGNRYKSFNENSPEELEKKLNDFVSQFDAKGDEPSDYCDTYPLGGNRVLVRYPIFKEEKTDG